MTTLCPLLVLLAVLLFSSSAATDVIVTVTTRRRDGHLRSEKVWEGYENVTLGITGTSWMLASIPDDNTFPVAVFSELSAIQTHGFDAFRDAIFPTNSNPFVEKNATHLVLQLQPAPGFVIKNNLTINISNMDSFVELLPNNATNGSSSNGTNATDVVVVHSTTLLVISNMQGAVTHFKIPSSQSNSEFFNEYNVRTTGLSVLVSLTYDRFLTSPQIQLASSDATLHAASWSIDYLPDGYTVNVSLAPIADFDIAADRFISISVSASNVFLGIAPAPSSTSLPVFTIDNKPIAFCRVLPSSFTEAELRSGPRTSFITLHPPDVDHFKTDNVSLAALQDALTHPPEVNVTIDIVNASTVSVTVSTASDHNIDLTESISLVPPMTTLHSAEAGCGALLVTLDPSPGTATALNMQNIDESYINANLLSFDFVIAYDSVIADASGSTVMNVTTRLFYTRDAGRAVLRSFKDVVTDMQVTVEEDAAKTRVAVVVPAAPHYNLPDTYVEQVSFFFPGKLMKSGVAPDMFNNTLNISFVKPTFNIAFGDDLTTDIVSAEALWQNGVTLHLTLTGDEWNQAGQGLWNFNHPTFSGTAPAESNFSFNRFHSKTEKTSVVDYNSVTIQDRTATIDVRPMPGIALQFDERVFVAQVSQLISGRPVVTRSSFTIKQARPFSIVVNFGGAAAPGRELDENDVRAGFTIAFNITHEVVNEAELALRYASMFPNPQSLESYLTSGGSAPTRVSTSTVPGVPYAGLVTFGPWTDYDIVQDEAIPVVIPSGVYMYTQPAREQQSTIVIRARPSPSCVFVGLDQHAYSPYLTEKDIRSADFLLEIHSSERFVNTPDTIATLNQSMTSTFQTDKPLILAYGGNLSDVNATNLALVIKRNESYDIISDDTVEITLNRLLFLNQERCATLTLTVTVIPGSAFAKLPEINETTLRTQDVQIEIFIVGEAVLVDQFLVMIDVEQIAENEGHGFAATYLTGPNKNESNLTAYRDVSFVSREEIKFVATIPMNAEYDIARPENVTFSVPEGVLASQMRPTIVNASFVIQVTNGTMDALFENVTTEYDVFRGNLNVTLTLDSDQWAWDVERLVESMKRSIRVLRSDDGTLLSVTQHTDIHGVSLLLSNENSRKPFTLLNNRTLLVQFQPNAKFDIVNNCTLSISIGADAILSGLIPHQHELAIAVNALPGKFIASGPGLFVGSRALIDGPVHVYLFLQNDLFVWSEISKPTLCALTEGSCTTSLDVEASSRNLTITFLPPTNPQGYFLHQNLSYQLHFTPPSVVSGVPPPNVTMFIFVQGGNLLFELLQPPSRITETMLRTGSTLLTLSIQVKGGDFVNYDSSEVAASLIEAVKCTPSSDEYGFCSRLPYMLSPDDFLYCSVSATQGKRCFRGDEIIDAATHTSGAVLDNAEVQITLQPDELYDIYRDETVNISLSGRGVASHLPPQGWVAFTIHYSVGRYFFSASHTTLYSPQLATKEYSVQTQILLKLDGERFVPGNAQSVVDAFYSLSSTSREANGFQRWKRELFLPPTVSADGRTLSAVFTWTPSYRVFRSETLIFSIAKDGVLGNVAPTLSSTSNTITVETASLATLVTPKIISVDTVRRLGINITLILSDEWDQLSVTQKSIQSSFTSLSPPSNEPNGFSVLKDEMVPTTAKVVLSNLSLPVRPNPRYALLENENIRVALPSAWNSKKTKIFPDHITLQILSNKDSLVAVLENPVDVAQFREDVAHFAGMTTETVLIEEVVPYGDAENRFLAIRFQMLNGDAAGERTARQATTFLTDSDKTLLKTSTDILILYYSSAPPTAREINLLLGIETRPPSKDFSTNYIVAYCAAALLLIGLAAWIVYYKRVVQRAMHGGTNRFEGDEMMLNMKLMELQERALSDPVPVPVYAADEDSEDDGTSGSSTNKKKTSSSSGTSKRRAMQSEQYRSLINVSLPKEDIEISRSALRPADVSSRRRVVLPATATATSIATTATTTMDQEDKSVGRLHHDGDLDGDDDGLPSLAHIAIQQQNKKIAVNDELYAGQPAHVMNRRSALGQVRMVDLPADEDDDEPLTKTQQGLMRGASQAVYPTAEGGGPMLQSRAGEKRFEVKRKQWSADDEWDV